MNVSPGALFSPSANSDVTLQTPRKCFRPLPVIQMRNVILCLLAFLYAEANSRHSALANVLNEKKRVLIIHSYHKGFSWTDGIDAGIRELFKDHNDVELLSEYLDSKRYSLDDVAHPTLSLMKAKYDSIEPDVIIVTDNNALSFLRQNRQKLLPTVPLVFCGINNYRAALIDDFERPVTGVVETVAPAETVKLIRTLQPDLRRLVMITGMTATAKAVREEVDNALTPECKDIALLWWDGLTSSQLVRQLRELHRGDAVLLILFNRDGDGHYYSYEDAATLVADSCPVPVYGMWDFYMGSGVVGGMMAGSFDQGRMAAKLAKPLLESKQTPPVITASPNTALFDYVAMTQHGLDPQKLPAEAVLLNKPEPDRWPTILAFSFGALLIATLAISIVEVMRRSLSSGRIKLTCLVVRSLQGAVIILVVSLITAELIHGWFEYRDETMRVRSEHLDGKKEFLITMVNHAMEQIAFDRNQLAQQGLTENEIKEHVKERLTNASFSDDGYFFVMSFDGISLVNRIQPEIIGKNISEITDHNGVELVQNLIDAAKKPNGGFVTYLWNKPSGKKSVKKISYARGLADWQWVVGTGVYLDDIEMAIRQADERLKHAVITQTATTLVIGVVVLVGMRLVLRRAIRRIEDELGKLLNGLSSENSSDRLLQEDSFRIVELARIADGAGSALAIATQLRMNLECFFDTIDDFCFVLDLQGRVIAANNAVTRRLGYTLQELLNRPLADLRPQELRQQSDRELCDIAAGACVLSSIPLVNKAGQLVEVETHVVEGNWNGLPAMFAVSKDLTDLHRAQREAVVRAAEVENSRQEVMRMVEHANSARAAATAALKTTEAILEATPVGIIVVDRQKRIRRVNHAALAMIGEESAESIIGNTCHLRVCPAEVGACPVLDLGNQIDSTERSLIRANGEQMPILKTVVPVTLDGEDVLLEAFVDITDRKTAEEELRESNAMVVEALEREKRVTMKLERAMAELETAKAVAEAANRTKSEFLANMSHEIRTPMTAILGYTESMLDGTESEEQRLSAINTIRRNGEHLLQILNDILDISKIEAGKLHVEHIPCSPLQVVSEVKSLMQVRADAKNLSFIVEYVGTIPETIESDPTRLKQILVNLASNAIKFTEQGGVRLVARLINARPKGRQSPAEPMIRFDVIDTGIGITPEQLSRLFQPFSQADASMTRRYGGTGLGLMISKRLAQMLGGDILPGSNAHGGSTFSVSVPTGSLENVTMLTDPASLCPDECKASVKIDLTSALKGHRILLAEDGPDNQRLISHVLSKAGAAVTVAENGQATVEVALEARLQGVPFSIILMDMQMPVMDGYDATRLLRKQGYDGPIIALTAHAMSGDRETCLEAGCDEYATKPIDRKTLVATIQQFLPARLSV